MKKNTGMGLDHSPHAGGSPGYRNGLTYLLIGGGIGATLALLFAPKTGSQLRGNIADVTRKGYDSALDKARVLNEKSGEFVHAVREKPDTLLGCATGKTGSNAENEVVGSPIDNVAGNPANTTGGRREAFGGTSNVG